MSDFILGILCFGIGLGMLSVSIFILRVLYAHKRAEKYIRDNGLTSGIFVKHGMVIDGETGMVKPTSSPSNYAIRSFLRRQSEVDK